MRRAIAGAAILLLSAAAAGSEQEAVLAELPRHVAVNANVHSSGQPTAASIGKLRAAGIRTIIDLRPDAETPDMDEKALAGEAGLAYHSLPVSGAADLTPANVSRFDQLLRQSQADGVLVHCGSGNRVGAMMALRAKWIEGRSAEEALAIGQKAGMTGLASDVKRILEADATPPAAH